MRQKPAANINLGLAGANARRALAGAEAGRGAPVGASIMYMAIIVARQMA